MDPIYSSQIYRGGLSIWNPQNISHLKVGCTKSGLPWVPRMATHHYGVDSQAQQHNSINILANRQSQQPEPESTQAQGARNEVDGF